MTDEELIESLRLDFCFFEAADRIEQLAVTNEALTKERDEAINQQDSARHSVSVLEKRVKTFCDGWGIADKGRIEAEAKLAENEVRLRKAVEAFASLEKAASDVARRGAQIGPQWTKLTVALLVARAALAEIKGESHE